MEGNEREGEKKRNRDRERWLFARNQSMGRMGSAGEWGRRDGYAVGCVCARLSTKKPQSEEHAYIPGWPPAAYAGGKTPANPPMSAIRSGAMMDDSLFTTLDSQAYSAAFYTTLCHTHVSPYLHSDRIRRSHHRLMTLLI